MAVLMQAFIFLKEAPLWMPILLKAASSTKNKNQRTETLENASSSKGLQLVLFA